jgi:hypothetical protein
LLTIASTLMLAQNPRVVWDITTNDTFAQKPVPRWENGFLVAYDDDVQPPQIQVFDRTGKLRSKTQVALTGVPFVRVRTITVSSAGRVAISCIGRDDARGADFIAWVAPSGAVEFVVRTAAAGAYQMTFAPDGSLFALMRQGGKQSYDMIHHYDGNGQLLQTSLSIDTFGGDRDAAFGSGAPYIMAATKDRVGLLMWRIQKWVELSLDGQLMGQWPLPSTSKDLEGVALTPSGNVYIALSNEIKKPGLEHKDTVLLRLNKTLAQWEEIEARSLRSERANWFAILGTDADDLVIANSARHFMAVRTPLQ